MWMWMTRPISSVERAPSDSPVMRWHSKLTGDSAMRGARTPTDGTGVSPAFFEFADRARKIDGADVHPLGERLVDQIDDELAAIADVALGVLVAVAGGAGVARADAEDDDRRHRTDRVEEAERRRVDPPLAIDRRRQRDRPRHHGADEELIGIALRDRRQIEMHVLSPPTGAARRPRRRIVRAFRRATYYNNRATGTKCQAGPAPARPLP
jgi:hypothetical protein